MVARRRLLVAGAAGAVAAVLSRSVRVRADAGETGRLDPTELPRYVTDLFVPPVMPAAAASDGAVDSYVIGVRQFRQQVLPRGFPPTTVWGYGASGHDDTFHYPGRTIEARVDRPVQVTWVNDLVDGEGRFVPHLFPVDPTVHWANPAGGTEGRDRAVAGDTDPADYTGPVPLVTHLHGAHSGAESDGYPEAWYLPVARDIPDRYATRGSWYDEFRQGFDDRYRVSWRPGTATYHYPNDQPATALWYHDHALGLARLNTYAGPVGFYLLRGGADDLPAGVLPGPAPDGPGPAGEIPLVIQDRSFRRDGSLYYPAGRDLSEGFLADTIVVNGATWPLLRVAARRYRLRVLNGCNARHLILKIAADPTARPARAAVPLWQIGGDGGFLPEPVESERVPLASGERVDLIVDFAGLAEGTELYLINEGPEGHGGAGRDAPADPATTGQVLKFQVEAATTTDRSIPPEQLWLPSPRPLGAASTLRRLSLNVLRGGSGGYALGLVGASGRGEPLRWHDRVTETPTAGVTETWEFHNFTGAAHPVHLHQVQFRVVGRGADGRRMPEPGERGFKDTVLVEPGQLTRVKVRFDVPGRYVWHCHVLEHEDREMMRPIQVGGEPAEEAAVPASGTTTPAAGTATPASGAAA